MKLPGIQYGRPVQSLGRVDAGAEAAVGRAWSNAALQWSKVFATAADDAAETEAYQSAQNAIRDTQILEDQLRREKVWNTATMGPVPDGVNYNRTTTDATGATVERTQIPMHEIGGQLYEVATKGIAKQHGSNLSGKVRRLFDTKYGAHVTSRRPHILEQQYKNAMDHGAAAFQSAVSALMDTATLTNRASVYDEAEKLYRLGAQKGYWTAEEAQKKSEEAREDIAYSAYLNAAQSTDSERELRAMQTMMRQDPMLSEGNQRLLFNDIEDRINAQEAAFERADKKRRDANDTRLLLQLLTGTGNPRDVVQESLRNGSHNGTRKLIGIVNSNTHYGPGVSDAQTLTAINEMIAGIDYSGDVDGQVEDIRDIMYSSGNRLPISGEHFAQINNRLDAIKQAPYTTESFRTANQIMYRSITGTELQGEEAAFGKYFGAAISMGNMNRYNEAYAALRENARINGRRFDAVGWWTANQEKFSRFEWESRKAVEFGLDPSEMRRQDDGQIDWSDTVWNEAVAAGTMTLEEKNDRVRRMNALKRVIK